MGFRVSWIARAGTSTEELLKATDRRPTGERHEFPDVGWYLLELPSAGQSPWTLLIADGSDNYGGLDPAQAQSLSAGGNETLYFWCSDTVMATVLVCFRNGSEVWSIDYDCGNKNKRPALNGAVPQMAHEILAQLQKKQQADDGADYIYDLTAELGRKLVGFRHDMELKTGDPEPFQVLESLGGEAGPLRRWVEKLLAWGHRTHRTG